MHGSTETAKSPVHDSRLDWKGELSCPPLLKNTSRNARSCLLDPMALLAPVSSTPLQRTPNGASGAQPKLTNDPGYQARGLRCDDSRTRVALTLSWHQGGMELSPGDN